MGRVSLSEEQINRIMDAIGRTNAAVSEIKGTIAAYASGLENERKEREVLGHRVDKHDEILRGDGTKDKPGLIEQIGDVRTLAQEALKGVAQIRNAVWLIGSPIAVAIIIDVVLRLLPLLYGTPVQTP